MEILALNVGSSSLKISLYRSYDEVPERLVKITINGLNNSSIQLKTEVNSECLLQPQVTTFPESTPLKQLLTLVWQQLTQADLLPDRLVHRIVHGGEKYFQAVKIDNQVFSDLTELSVLAPLHQPPALEVIRLFQGILPKDIDQYACFDTAFHQNMPSYKTIYALPESIRAQGIRRYGFHGLSYQHVYKQLCDKQPEQFNQRVIIAHLGSGVSVCAIHQGQSQDFSMGFSALEGPVMSTRAGRLDAGIILKLLTDGYSANQLEKMLFKDSGWSALSGIGADINSLFEVDNERCRLAIDHFIFQVVREIAALLPALNGLDTLVFTGGIGENIPQIRDKICNKLKWFGVVVDQDSNKTGQYDIAATNSKVQLKVIKCNEALSMVQQVT
ncbi:acetate/propionate family kinase [Pelagibaculum spongiae]|uniref:Acetate kinase n=1 Tax=Pelagibaculum spongiae TaxID=2080658 RepID=A0A2V1H272_9GAMM|nr:acetate/propionate family kinase [Pelagibaculum spongiae]PVZ70542.1 acetate kinase [Pelagibaculum spongiae]